MNETRIRNGINFSALALFVLYVVAVAVSLLVGCLDRTLDDERMFAFIFNLALWGGVTLLGLTLLLMLAKLAILKK